MRVDEGPSLRVMWGRGGVLNSIRRNAARMVNLVGPVVAAEPGCRAILQLSCGAASALATSALASARPMAAMRGSRVG